MLSEHQQKVVDKLRAVQKELHEKKLEKINVELTVGELQRIRQAFDALSNENFRHEE